MLVRIRCYELGLRAVLLGVAMAAYLFAALLRFGAGFGAAAQHRTWYVPGLFVFAVTWMLAAEALGLAKLALPASLRLLAWRSACAAVLAGTASLAVLFFSGVTAVSRLFVAAAIAVTMPLACIAVQAFRSSLQSAGQKRPLRLVIVGTDSFARRTAARLRRSVPACEVIGFLALPHQDVAIPASDLVTLHRLRQAPPCCDDIVIAARPERWSDAALLFPLLRTLGMPIRIVAHLGMGTQFDPPAEIAGMQLFSVASAPPDSLRYVLLKRCFDVAFSAAALLVAAPLLALIAAAIKLTSPGPVLFRQQRVGLHGETFTMLKFRTMRMAGGAESDTRWTTANDSRRTTVGAFLRRTSLDELPQFWNCLEGDMSVVGPRPERPYFVRKFAGQVGGYNRRHLLKAGITGWAQVNGWRGDTSIRRRVEHDLYYLRNWSFAFDLRIIARTLWSGLSSRNAY